MGIGLCTVLWVCRPKCHCKASESSEVPPLQRLLMHNAEWQTIKSVFGGTFIHFWDEWFHSRYTKMCSLSVHFYCIFIFPLFLYRDRLRTTTNVLGDSIGAGIVEHLSRRELQNQDAEVRNSVIEENEKPYQLICQENDSVNHRNSETTMWRRGLHPERASCAKSILAGRLACSDAGSFRRKKNSSWSTQSVLGPIQSPALRMLDDRK